MAFKVFTNGSVLNASEINENLMRQSVIVFSNAAARTAAIASPVEGMLTYLEDVNRYENWNSSAWVSPFGLTLVKSQTIGTAVSSVTVTDAFNANYDSYKVIITGGSNSASGVITMQLTGLTGGYFGNVIFANTSGGAVSSAGINGASSHNHAGSTRDGVYLNVEVINPFLAVPTHFVNAQQDVNAGWSKCVQTSSTSTTGFTINITAGTITGGTISVYGFRKA